MLTSSTMQETAGTQATDTKKDQASLLQQLTTESQNEASQGFDTKSALEIARIINHEDAKVAAAVKKAIPEIAEVIDQVARSLRDGGRLIYIGAGSSGRIAALDASECPPTYSTAPGQVQYIMAGGPKALASAVERMERTVLDAGQRLELAVQALALRFPKDLEGAVEPSRFLVPRRPEDAGNDLWRTFNVLQENLLQGGILRRSVSNRLTRTRRITAIREDVRLNSALWEMAVARAA